MLPAVYSVIAAAVPTPSPDAGGLGLDSFVDIVPLVTGAGGALVVLLGVVWMFISDKITTVGSVEKIRDADNLRFQDMKEQRDSLLTGIEKANTTAALATENVSKLQQLLRDVVSDKGTK